MKMALVLNRRNRGQWQMPQQQNLAQQRLGLVVPRRRRRRNRVRNAAALVPVNQINGARLVRQAPLAVQPQGLIPLRRNRGRRRGVGPAVGSVPSAFSARLQGGRPFYNGRQEMVVQHSEVFATLNGTNGFSGNRWVVVPQLFPWLNGVASNFSRYRWLQVGFEFITASPTSQGGSIAMGAGYDVVDDTPNSLEEVAAMSHGVLEQVWSGVGGGLSVDFDCTKWNQAFYNYIPIPAAGIPSGQARSYQAYIPGVLYFGRDTQVNGQTIGQIRAHYTICLEDPIPSRINASALSVGNVQLASKWGVDDSARPCPPDMEEMGNRLARQIGATSAAVEELAKSVSTRLAIEPPEETEEEPTGSSIKMKARVGHQFGKVK